MKNKKILVILGVLHITAFCIATSAFIARDKKEVKEAARIDSTENFSDENDFYANQTGNPLTEGTENFPGEDETALSGKSSSTDDGSVPANSGENSFAGNDENPVNNDPSGENSENITDHGQDSPTADVPLEEESFSGKVAFSFEGKGNLNIRETPSANASVIAKIPNSGKGTILSVENNTWAKVSYKDITGYCDLKYLTYKDEELSALSGASQTSGGSQDNRNPSSSDEAENGTGSPESLQPDGSETKQEETLLVSVRCHIRSTPDASASDNILMTADIGTVLTRNKSEDRLPNWYAVTLDNGQTAYVGHTCVTSR